MSWFSLVALCAVAQAPANIDCVDVEAKYITSLQSIKLSEQDLDAITRTTYAEAANQGDIGLTSVIFTILNRRISDQFGGSIQGIINAKNQFEPVTKAGGWENLPSPNKAQRLKVETIVNLATSGYLSDPTQGALYFQNSEIVAKRAIEGSVSPHLVHFGGSKATNRIEDHSFYSIWCQPEQGHTKSKQWKKQEIHSVKQLRGGSQETKLKQ